MESADATRGSSVAAPTHAEGYALDAARRPLAPHVSYDRLRSLKVTVDAAIKVTLTFSLLNFAFFIGYQRLSQPMGYFLCIPKREILVFLFINSRTWCRK
jgi:hypothetical protein